MSNINSLLKEIFALGSVSENIILNVLEERKTLKGYISDVTDEVRESRFSKGKCCPHCEGNAICKNGKYNGKQRYLCKMCRKTFTDFTYSPSYNRKKSLDKWMQYAKCMVVGYSIARCAIDRAGNIIAEPIGKGRVKGEAIENLFSNRIAEDSIVCVDSCRSFIKFAQNSNINLQQIKRGKRKEGIYHIQHVNSFHSRLKTWMLRFKGVATKYLSSYLSWFRWLEFFKSEKEIIKAKNLLIHTYHVKILTRIADLSVRQTCFV